MKKIFLMALSVFLFSTTASFAGNDDNSNKVANEIEVSIEKAEPIYWEGYARVSKNIEKYLKVYQTPGQCNSFVAHIYYNSKSNEKLGEAWVKENPDYGKRSGGMGRLSELRRSDYKYYITYRGDDYYFNM